VGRQPLFLGGRPLQESLLSLPGKRNHIFRVQNPTKAKQTLSPLAVSSIALSASGVITAAKKIAMNPLREIVEASG
jgi:hypothetical protein